MLPFTLRRSMGERERERERKGFATVDDSGDKEQQIGASLSHKADVQ